MRNILDTRSPDVSIVAAAYERWGAACFAKLVGDWSLSIWNPREQSLTLAKDPIGTRHLYYSLDSDQVTWSSILDPLILLAGKTFPLEEEYIAGWLSFFPATHLTPYVGIHSAPPSSSVLIRAGKYTVSRYWDFDPSKRIHHRTDAEYEEHFRAIFAESVRRRLRSDSPVLAELSGGMDSSSIVCMADTIVKQGAVETPRLDTISYYDDSEPNWNERPYFAKVEEARGRAGRHIDLTSQRLFKFETDHSRFASTPGAINCPSEAAKEIASCIGSQRNRVVLSGTGGDEVTGGVPTPTPELADLIAHCRLRALSHQLRAWALHQRRPWFRLLFEAVGRFLPRALVHIPKQRLPAFWLNRNFVKRNRAALIGYETRVKLFGPRPSFQENVSTLDVLRRQLECSALSAEPLYEKRYPYLDRDLLEFTYALARGQFVRPGQRRSLMRRALVGIVPEEVLNRKRKAFVVRATTVSISTECAALTEAMGDMVSASLGIVNAPILVQVLQQARHSQDISLIPLLRTLAMESWLRSLKHHRVWDGRPPIIARKKLTPSGNAALEEFS